MKKLILTSLVVLMGIVYSEAQEVGLACRLGGGHPNVSARVVELMASQHVV